MSKLRDALIHRKHDRMDNVERDFWRSELDALLEIVYKLDLQNSHVVGRHEDKTVTVMLGVHSSETRLGILKDVDQDEASELIALLDELIPLIEMARKSAKA